MLLSASYHKRIVVKSVAQELASQFYSDYVLFRFKDGAY